MNPETARVLIGEQTINYAPYLDLPPIRRPDATGQTPASPPLPARPMPLTTEARPGRGRHRLAEPWRMSLAVELVVAVVLAVIITALLVAAS